MSATVNGTPLGGHGKVRGQRSPRWAFMQRMTMPCHDGTDYLVRLRIVQTPWFGIYLHDIHEDDGDRAPHNHPWSFLSIVLRGHYIEVLYRDPLTALGYFVTQTHRRFSIHGMGRVAAHRIIDAGPRLKTLIITGPRQANWGFFEHGRFVEWQDYEREWGTL